MSGAGGAAPSMQELVAALTQQHAELAALLAERDDAAWQRPSRCAGWDVADVVLHLAQTDELALASVQGRFGELVSAFVQGASRAPVSVDDAAALQVERERDGDGAAVGARWAAGAAALRSALLTADPSARVTWVAGELSVRTLAATRLAECWIHTGDVADALDVTLVPGDRLRHVARLAWRTLPYAFAQADRELHGDVAFVLSGPGGDRWQFGDPATAATVVEGDGIDLCLVAARRVDPATTSLLGTGPDADAVLALVRTYA